MTGKIAQFLNKPDFGLLVIRVAAGAIFCAAGIGKLLGGQSTLEYVGSQMGNFGIDFAPLFWGVLAALTETIGGILLAVGFLFRGAAFMLLGTMIVATVTKAQGADAGSFIQDAGYPFIMAAVSMGLLFVGPGKYTLGKSLG